MPKPMRKVPGRSFPDQRIWFFPRVAPQDVEPQPREDVSAGVKEAVPKRVDLQVLNTLRRVARACQHVMPLKELMQDDAIKEPAQTQSEQDAGGNRKAAIL